MLDALIDGQNGDVAGLRQPARVEQELEIAEDGGAAVGIHPDALDEIRTGKVQPFLADLRSMFEKRFRLVAEQLFEFAEGHRTFSG